MKRKCVKVFSGLIKVLLLLAVVMLIAPPSSAFVDEPPAIDAKIDVDPNVFSLKSKGKSATVYIEFSDTCPYDVRQIDVGSVILSVNGYNIPADTKSKISDYDHDGVPDLKVKFSRQELQSRMFVGLEELTVSGSADGAEFVGSDTVSVKSKGVTSTILQTSDVHRHVAGR